MESVRDARPLSTRPHMSRAVVVMVGALLVGALGGMLAYQDAHTACTFSYESLSSVCPDAAGASGAGLVAFAALTVLGAVAMWFATRRRSNIGELSLLAAIAVPCAGFFPVFANEMPVGFDVWPMSFLLLVPIGLALAIVAGRRAKAAGDTAVTALVGRTLGWIELALSLFFLVGFLNSGTLTEPL
jgi:hypothetical protein